MLSFSYNFMSVWYVETKINIYFSHFTLLIFSALRFDTMHMLLQIFSLTSMKVLIEFYRQLFKEKNIGKNAHHDLFIKGRKLPKRRVRSLIYSSRSFSSNYNDFKIVKISKSSKKIMHASSNVNSNFLLSLISYYLQQASFF